jgi:SAM-dependent methyltransferase
MNDLDHPDRVREIRQTIERKQPLKRFYYETYERYRDCLSRCPPDGIVVELGSGGGFLKDVIPDAITSDVLPYEGVDQVVDATRMPFADSSVRAIFMSNVFHHIPDVDAFFKEATRCLKPGGRILIMDQYCGFFSSFIYRYVHHEGFDPQVKEWKFESTGPLSGANGALACIVFQRDLKKFESKYPLKMAAFRPHSPFRYWWVGGLKSWSLLPVWLDPFARWLDRTMIKCSREFASFVDIELIK